MRLCFDKVLILIFVTLCCSTALENDLTYLKAFDDSIIYRLVWDTKEESLLKEEISDLETITMVSSRKEKYVCALPKMQEKKQVYAIEVSFCTSL